jgi:TRAP-type mannitol/chloroaromatic compound transport system permease large subunit
MIDMIAHNLPLIMFSSCMLLILLGYPVAFTLAAGGLIYFVIGVELSIVSPEIKLFWPLLQSHPDRIYGIMYNDTLLAIPFFTLMGILLERSGMAEDLLDTVGQLFGPVRGGLAYAVILVGAVLGATTSSRCRSCCVMAITESLQQARLLPLAHWRRSYRHRSYSSSWLTNLVALLATCMLARSIQRSC